VRRDELARAAAFTALVIAVVAIVLLLFTGGSSYKVYAQFEDAGQLVNGDLVTLGGHQVGSVGGITLSGNGLASVELDLSDSSVMPLHEGTIATVGQLSLTGVANRFVGLTLGVGKEIPNHGTIPPTQTKGIVDLDVLLDALTPRVRTSLQHILKTGADLFSSPTPQQFNQSIRYLNPALSQTAQLGQEIVADRFALERLVASSANVSSALAARNGDLAGAVTNTAAALREIASERAALEDTFARAPAVLTQATSVMRDVDNTLSVLNPVLTDLQPVAPRLATFLTKLLPAASNAIPTIKGVEALVPSAKQALTALPPVERKATPAVKSLTNALVPLTPVLAGLRAYIPDVVGGFFNNFTASTGMSYDANGEFIRVQPLVGLSASLTGLLNAFGGLTGSIPPLNGQRSGLLARCPGGAAPPASGGGNPWTSPDIPASLGSICNPADDQR
jgi:phospholipid/cholesterol/gamma-HCH transport system substrate-binding protein